MRTAEQCWNSLSRCPKAVRAVLALAILSLSAVVTTALAQDQTKVVPAPPARAKVAGPSAHAQIKLIDPDTKHVIGYYDQTKKVLVFPKRNMALPRKLIARVSGKEYKLLKHRCDEMKNSNLKYMNNPPPQEQTATGGKVNATTIIVDGVRIDGNLPSGTIESGGNTERSGACANLCWYMAEGGASCRGCCTPVNADACYCWEECSDESSEIAK